MKRIITLTALLIGFSIISCKKDDATNTAPASPQGKWVGTAQYGTSPGGTPYFFSLNLKADGTVDIVGNNNTAADNATGNWALVQDSVKVTYTYVTGTITYSLAGRYSASSNTMTGTIGFGLQTSGSGLFNVNRQ